MVREWEGLWPSNFPEPDVVIIWSIYEMKTGSRRRNTPKEDLDAEDSGWASSSYGPCPSGVSAILLRNGRMRTLAVASTRLVVFLRVLRFPPLYISKIKR